jgi:hypothetical protein
MSEADLHDRQRRLAEIGDAGQSRIERAGARISSRDEGSMIELSYLLRAGVRSASIERAEPRAFPHAGAFRFAVARTVGAGAWRALDTLRRALEVGT